MKKIINILNKKKINILSILQDKVILLKKIIKQKKKKKRNLIIGILKSIIKLIVSILK